MIKEQKVGSAARDVTNEFASWHDWHLTGLATDPEADPDLKERAMAEIKRRQEAGTYELKEPTKRKIGNNALQGFKPKPHYEPTSLPPAARKHILEHSRRRQLPSQPESIEAPESQINAKAQEIYENYVNFLPAYTGFWTIEGTRSLIEEGNFALPTTQLVTAGFYRDAPEHIDRQIELYDHVEPAQRPSREAFTAEYQLKHDVVKELIEPHAQNTPNRERNNSIRKGISYAVSGGARVRKQGMSEEVVYAFPFERKDDFETLMKNFGLETKIPEKDPADPEFPNAAEVQKLRLSAETGFFNIINAVKDKPKEIERAKQYLDWYYDTFEFAKHANELENNIVDEEYSGDELYREFRDAYLASKPGFKEGTRLSYGFNDGENAQPDNLSGPDRRNLEHILAEGKAKYEDINTIFNQMIDQMSTMMVHDADGKEMFPVACLMQYGEGYSQKLRELGVQSQEAERVIRTIRCIDRCNAGFAVAKRIHDEIDPYADFSIDAVYRDKNTGEKVLSPGNIQLESRVYLSIRFGTENKDAKIAFPITGADAAMFGWAGDTHFDSNAWQSVFERSINDRDPEVRKTTSNNHSTLGEEAILRQWDRMFSKIGLRSVRPFSALRGANAEQASSADRARLLDVREAIPFDELVEMCENGTISKNPDIAKIVTRHDPVEFTEEQVA